MRGGLSLGGPGQTYASDITTSYDPKSGVYTSEVFSRGGLYRVEAWDQTALHSKVTEILQNEYREMTRELSTQRARPFGSGIGGDGVERRREHGVNVMVLKAGDRNKSSSMLGKAVSAAELSSMMFAAMRGDWASVLTSMLGKAVGEYLSKEGQEHGHDLEEVEEFAAEFGGVLITAATPALLLKKLLFQKNRRIAIIMSHMRSLEENRLNGSTVENIGKGMYGRIGVGLSSRMRRKKFVAEKSWRTQAINKGEHETGWQGKALNLRDGIASKREEAKYQYENMHNKALWTERV